MKPLLFLITMSSIGLFTGQGNLLAQSQGENERVGKATVNDTTYISAYSTVSMDYAEQYWMGFTMMQKGNVIIVLLYNDRKNTPSTEDLQLESKRMNESLTGGIEKNNGHYYALELKKGKLERGKEIVAKF